MVIGPVVSEILGGGGTTPQMLLHCQKEQMLLTDNMSKMCLKTFSMSLTCQDDYTFKVPSQYKAINLPAVANMSEKAPQDLLGLVHPPF